MCKRKLRSSSKKFKSFLPPSLVFLPHFFNFKSWVCMSFEHEIWANFKAPIVAMCCLNVDFYLHLLEKYKSFLPPSLVFYPTFLALKFAQISRSKLICTQLLMLKKWGKKLVRGVKNFRIIKYDISAFFCTKNHVKILKTRANRFTLKLKKIEKKFSQPKQWYFFKFSLSPRKFQFFSIFK